MMVGMITSLSVFFIMISSNIAIQEPRHGITTTRGSHRRNVVFIICDAMDGRLVGNNESASEMSNINGRLVQNGVTFTSAYTNSPICCPSRSALWSGLYTHITQTWNNYKGLPKGYPTWKDYLDKAGYDTKILGKTDYTVGDHSLSNRVEAWTREVNFTLAQEGRPTPVLVGDEHTRRIKEEDWSNVDLAKDWLKSRTPGGKPFLLYIGIVLPHPYKTTQEGPRAGGSTFKTSPYWLKKVDRSKITIPKWKPLDQMHPVDYYETATKNCTSNFTEDEILKIRAYYYGMCAEVDGMVGELLDTLDISGFSNSTSIIFTSDHGEMAMEHRQFYKMTMYEASSHVPLIITSPDKETHNTKVDDPVSLIDVYPTLMDITETSGPPGLNGTSLMPYLERRVAHHGRPHWVLSQYHGCNINMSTYMLRKGKWKYITYGNGFQVSPHLFNLDKDPDELLDYAETRKDIVMEMDKTLRTILDYPTVSKAVNKYNKESFVAWKNSLGDKYGATIANLRWFKDWQKDPKGNEQKIEEWLNSPET
ncbi:arylsulfatase K-like [Ptychodera flava]|uniref:arylsulfatase K-like n=1 Tax=Ptychodera flava TaxID=63121 RepID=UPI00396A3717